MNSIENVLKKFSYVLKFYRHLRGRSQQSLAEEAGLSFRNYQRLENGEVMCRMDSLIQLSNLLEVPTGVLLDDVSLEVLGIIDVSHSNDFLKFDELITQRLNVGPAEMEKVFRAIPNDENIHFFDIEANKAIFDKRFQHRHGLPSHFHSTDTMIPSYKMVEWWQKIHQHSFRRVLTNNLFFINKKPVMAQVYHHIHSTDPRCPRSSGILIDKTQSSDLKNLLESSLSRFSI